MLTWLVGLLTAAAALVAIGPWPGGRIPAARWQELAEGTAPGSRPPSPPRSRTTSTSRAGHDDGAAECSELLAVAISSGCTVTQAIVEVGGTTSAGDGVVRAARQLERGTPLHGVLEELAQGSQAWQSLATSLATAASSGCDVAGSLRDLAAAERKRIRRRREAAARRLPVLLLIPLAGLVLPAFAMVTVVPFALAAAESFELPPATDTGEAWPDPGGS